MARAIVMILLMAIVLVATTPTTHAMDITNSDLASEESLWALYERWCKRHNVGRDLSDKARRFKVFKENTRIIHEFNQGDAPYKLSLNLFGDMTDEEVDHMYGRCSNIRPDSGKRRQDQFTHGVVVARDNLPMYVDWRMTGYDQRPSAVTSVKIQGDCGGLLGFCGGSSSGGHQLHQDEEPGVIVCTTAHRLRRGKYWLCWRRRTSSLKVHL
ncbi:hypothetical protein CFC21_086200 [Triticum aestivum]|uniref:Cathepsin propeptide inhibitor domain-containing protein n=2 Tax=Triticum aestivum TaxID=4565 RepID=A0A9R1IEK4_WHEAT|nr:hypothetical protein CFC21_086200 [Triticum aestivum]